MVINLGGSLFQTATSYSYYNSSTSSITTSSTASTPTPVCTSGMSCPVTCASGTAYLIECDYQADIVIPYWLPTTITVTAATVYYNGTTAYTVTNNLTSYYSSIASALVPTAQREDAGPWAGQTTVDLVFGTTEAQYYTYYGTSTSVDPTAYATFTAGTAYMLANIDGLFDIYYYCSGTSAGTTFSDQNLVAVSITLPPEEAIIVALPTNDPLWGDPASMSALSNEVFTTVPALNSAIASLNPGFPSCNGALDGFPSPKVVVNALTATVGTPAWSSTAQPQGAGSNAPQPAQTGSAGTGGYGTTGSGDPPANSGPSGSGYGSGSGSDPVSSAGSGSGSSAGSGSGANAGSGSGSGGRAGAGGATFAVGGSTYTASGGAVSIGGTTLSPGSGAVTTNGEVVSVGSAGVVVSPAYSGIASYVASGLGGMSGGGATTYAFGGGGGDGVTATQTYSGAVITVGGQTYTETEGGVLVIGSTTLSAGGSAVTISGTVVSVGTSGVVVGSKTASYSAVYTGPVYTGGSNVFGHDGTLTVLSWLCGLAIGAVMLI